MTNRSQQAARYGALAERIAFDRYGLEPDRGATHDGRDRDGRPWDVKACMLSRRSPRFRLWKDQHAYLDREGGGYVFVGYVPTGNGIRVKKIRTVRAASMNVQFYGAGDHQKGDQVKVNPDVIFGR